MNEPHSVVINGEARSVRARSVAELIDELNLPAATVLVEHNGDALQRHEWPDRSMGAGDRVEILRVAAGG